MSGGFRPPEPVWHSVVAQSTRPQPTNHKKAIVGVSLTVAILAALLGVFGWYTEGGSGTHPAKDVVSGTATIRTGPTSAKSDPIGSCFDFLYTVDDSVIDGSGTRLSCNDQRATYKRVNAGPENYSCQAGEGAYYRVEQQLDDGQTACLVRLFKTGQCSPISTAQITNATAMAEWLVVPCHTPTSRAYPALARVTQVVPDTSSCPGWAWPTDTKGIQICVSVEG